MRLTPSTRDIFRVLRDPIIGAVTQDIPAIAAAQRRLDAYRAGIPDVPDAFGQTIDAAEAIAHDTVVDALDAGRPIPPDVFQGVVEAHLRVVGAAGANETARRIDEALSQALDDAITSHRDAIYGQLHQRLTAAVDAARDGSQDLAGATTAEAAIAADKADSWRAVTNARAEYVRIRAAQRLMYRYADEVDETDKLNRVVLVLANPGDVWDRVGAWLWTGTETDRRGNVRHLEPPWPDPWRGTDGVAEHFDWAIATPDARPWVPTTTERDDAWASLAQARDGHSVARPKVTDRSYALGVARHLTPTEV